MKKLIVTAVMAAAVMFGSLIISPVASQAGTLNGAVYDHQADREQGYHDGLDRGREDAGNHRSFNPKHSDHYRHGNRAYKEGFRRGYEEGYGRRY
jgi:hypothetical protein